MRATVSAQTSLWMIFVERIAFLFPSREAEWRNKKLHCQLLHSERTRNSVALSESQENSFPRDSIRRRGSCGRENKRYKPNVKLTDFRARKKKDREKEERDDEGRATRWKVLNFVALFFPGSPDAGSPAALTDVPEVYRWQFPAGPAARTREHHAKTRHEARTGITCTTTGRTHIGSRTERNATRCTRSCTQHKEITKVLWPRSPRPTFHEWNWTRY